MRLRPRHLSGWPAAWIVALAGLGGGAIVGFLLQGSTIGGLLQLTAGLAGPACIELGVRRHRPDASRAWRGMALGILLVVAASLSATATYDISGSGNANPLMLIGFTVTVVSAFRLIRGQGPEGSLPVFLEALVVATGTALIAWFALVQPWLVAEPGASWTDAILRIIYPSIDLALIGVAARTVWLHRSIGRAFRLLILAIVCSSIGDFGAFQASTAFGYTPGQLTDLGFVLVGPLIASAALHPSINQPLHLRARPGEPRIGPRLLIVTGSLLIPPVLLLLWVISESLSPGRAIAPRPGLPPVEAEIALGMLTLAVLVACRLFLALDRLGHVLHVRDELQVELHRQAFIDSLTALPNRAAFVTRLERALSLDPQATGLLFCDLDDFKAINDTLGHGAGDELLAAVGRRLRATIRPSDIAARLGGDEFGVLVTGMDDPLDADRVATRILTAFAEPFAIEASVFTVRLSIGVATGADAGDAAAVMRHADIAMYMAKEAGKGRSKRFQPGMQATIANRFALKEDLSRALEEEQFELAYQPIANIGTDRLVGVEALVRWHHPTRGVIQPLEFISVAEQTGIMEPLGRWILETACRQMRAWLDAGAPADTHVAVNVSPRQLAHAEFAADVREILVRSNLPAQNLILEITEGVLLDPDIALGVLIQLKALGLRIAIDDFGTGYSAMSYLARFPIDILKIDRSFISAMGREAHGDSVVQTILSLAHSFNLETIAEGIEDGDQLKALQQLGCVFGQGFLLGHPVDADELEGRLLPSRASIPRRDAPVPAVALPARLATTDGLG